MFCKIRNILLILLSFVLTNVEAKAQGLVSLSEEAMFEDELDTELKSDNKAEENKEVPLVGAEDPKPVAPTVAPAPEVLPQLSVEKANPVSVEEEIPVQRKQNNDVAYVEGRDSDLYNSLDGTFNLKDGDVFEHMTDIEKRTAILNMELRREKLQDDIEAIKYRRREALAKEKQKEEDQRLKNLETEKEIERKLVEEQEKLRALDIKFEKLRQEKVLGAYKNKMLEETQKWIEHDAKFYKEIADLRASKRVMAESLRDKMSAIKTKANEVRVAFVDKVKDFERKIEDKDSQISILRTRVANLEKEREEARRNPFAGMDREQIAKAAGIDVSVLDAVANAHNMQDGGVYSQSSEPVETDLTKLYAVTEIRGKGDELVARLVNQSGTAFYVKKGTSLQSGHVITKITTTYVMAEKSGDRQYLYFSAGGILPTEVSTPEMNKQ